MMIRIIIGERDGKKTIGTLRGITWHWMECRHASTVDNPIRNYHNPDWLHGSAKQILAAHITRCETCYTHSIAAQELWPVECDCYEEEGNK